MSDKRINKKDILNIVYRVMYMLPLSMAVIAEMRVYIGDLLETEKYAYITENPALQGGLYAGMVLLALLVAFLGSLVITLSKWTKVACAVIVPAAMITVMIMGVVPERFTVAGLLWLVPVLLADIVREFLKKEGESKVVFLLPFLLISFLMVAFIPSSPKPLDWSGVVGVYERIVERSKEFFGQFEWSGSDYSTAEIGFDSNSGLFKKLKKGHDKVMVVNREYPASGALYLTGKVYSDFDGNNWTQHQVSDGENTYGRMMDTLETRCAIEDTYPYNLQEVYSSVKVDIRINDIRTPYTFLPSKMVVGAGNRFPIVYDGDNILFEETKTYGYEYSLTYYMLNRNGEDLIKNHREITEENWDRLAMQFKPSAGEVYSIDDYYKYRENMKAIYGQVPELSNEVETLLAEITEGAETDYEKVCLIESWLASHVYTLDVGIKNKGINSESEFLDYFMLENTEGYCTYYATAFVLMVRAEGIPARYIQGYRVPSSGKKEIEVMSDMAHAWPEVYFEGVGWIRFEPTPGFSSVATWGAPLMSPEYYDELEAASTVEMPEEINEVEEEIVEEIKPYDNTEQLEEEARLRAEAQKRQQMIAIIVLATIGGLLVICLLAICVRMIVRSVKYDRMSKDEKRIELCRRCMLVLDSMGKRPEQGETLTEFGKRVSAETDFNNMLFIDVYEHMIYRSGSDVKVSVLADNYEAVKKLLRGRKKSKVRLKFAFGVVFDRKVI